MDITAQYLPYNQGTHDATEKLDSHGPLRSFKRGEIGKSPLVPTIVAA